MASLQDIQAFFSAGAIAVAGVSKDTKKFGSSVYKTLKERGKKVFPVNNTTDTIQGDACYPSVSALKNQVASVLLVVQPKSALQVLTDAAEANIKNIWFQPGSESPEAINYCHQHNMNYITGQCILMHAEPVNSMHKVHRFITKLTGKYPRK